MRSIRSRSREASPPRYRCRFDTRCVLDYVPEESALLVRGTSESPPLRSTQAGLPLWLIPTTHGAPRRIPNVVGNWADVSPDGRTLALIRAGEKQPPRLILAHIDGSRSQDLGPVPRDVFRPRWAPDGTRLRFFQGGFGRSKFEDSIWERTIQGGSPRSLWPGSRGDWTPDGRYFVYDREEAGAFRHDLFAQREARWGGFRKATTERLTVGPLSYWWPGVSRDGRQLFAFGRLGRGELMRFDPATNTFAPALGGESMMYVEPSPDGEWVVWVKYPEGTLWKSRPDGSQRQALTSTPMQAHLPRWSRDGRTIVFAGRTPDEPHLGIYRVVADGSASELVYRSTRANDHFWDPCWLNDRTLVFSRVFSTNPPGILQLDPNTGQITPLPGAESMRWPKCSRQGDLLAIVDQPSGFRYVVRRHDRDEWEDLGAARLTYPQWTRDGSSVCGIDLFNGGIDCLSLASKQVTTLSGPPPFPLLTWVGAAWIGLDANDRPLVVADRSKTAFYALDWEQP
jgi:dipeptidyl aminopeptidase/acylaminoacyl peptidase